MLLAKCLLPEMDSFKLDYLQNKLKLNGRNTHRSKDDVLLTKELMLFLKKMKSSQTRYLHNFIL
jgi:DNA polymerase III epsilon subunit-like protein